MGSWTRRGTRAGNLILLLLIPALLAGAELRPEVQAVSSIATSVVADELEEPNGLIVVHMAKPAPSGLLILAELAPKPAPLPVGPLTDVPVLYYHYIRINPNAHDTVGFGLSTPPAIFGAQMQYLADHGFHVISLHQAVAAIRHHSALPSLPVVLTFDDGYADFFTNAVPILQRHGFTATSFVITGRMGWNGYLTPNQVVAADGMGFTIGAHTVDHVALAAQTPARASWEMRPSKLALEELLGHPVLDFAYPYGSFNPFDVGEAKRLGFETAVSTLSGTVHSAVELFELSRLRVGGGLPLSGFARLVGGPPPTASELVA